MPDSAVRLYGQWITSYYWKPVLEAENTNIKLNTFYKVPNVSLDKHLRLKKAKTSVNNKPWITTKILELIKKRQKAFERG